MIDEALRVFKDINSKDFRILTGIEIGMKHFEWVPMEELNKYTRMPFEKLEYRLKKLVRNKLVVRNTQPYEGFQIYFEGYDALALNAFVKRKSISAIGDEVGVGKESVIYEAILPPELAIGKPVPVVIKFHREGRTSFKQIKRVREHLGEREHFSWIYAARLAAQREYDIMIPIFETILNEPEATALYISPLNALVNDQLKSFLEFEEKLKSGAGIARYTGALSEAEKRKVREGQTNVVLTNPEMIHM